MQSSLKPHISLDADGERRPVVREVNFPHITPINVSCPELCVLMNVFGSWIEAEIYVGIRNFIFKPQTNKRENNKHIKSYFSVFVRWVCIAVWWKHVGPQ